jgi:hypothetical protein
MSIVYVASEKSASFKSSFSDDLVEKLDNFKNYTPTWGLIGADELKLIFNIMGYENIFSKQIASNNQNSKDLSNNVFIASGSFLPSFLQFIVTGEKNISGLVYGSIVLLLTVILSFIILFGIAKIGS